MKVNTQTLTLFIIDKHTDSCTVPIGEDSCTVVLPNARANYYVLDENIISEVYAWSTRKTVCSEWGDKSPGETYTLTEDTVLYGIFTACGI